MNQTNDEKLLWTNSPDNEYHKRQFDAIYRSSVVFCDWLESLGFLSARKNAKVLDIGAGQGANLLYMAKRFESCHFTGAELNSDLVKRGNEYFLEVGQKNCVLEAEDLYELSKKYIDKYSGVISFQTLSWLPEYEAPIRKMAELHPDWIAISSLFFKGKSNCKIMVQDYSKNSQDKPRKEFYSNVYSLPLVKELFLNLGYNHFKYIPFDIDIDLPKPKIDGFSTYTERLEDGRRLQISGPLLMPWYFIVAWK